MWARRQEAIQTHTVMAHRKTTSAPTTIPAMVPTAHAAGAAATPSGGDEQLTVTTTNWAGPPRADTVIKFDKLHDTRPTQASRRKLLALSKSSRSGGVTSDSSEQAPAATAAEKLTLTIDESHGHPTATLGAVTTNRTLSLTFAMGTSTHREKGTHDGLDVGVALSDGDDVDVIEPDIDWDAESEVENEDERVPEADSDGECERDDDCDGEFDGDIEHDAVSLEDGVGNETHSVKVMVASSPVES